MAQARSTGAAPCLRVHRRGCARSPGLPVRPPEPAGVRPGAGGHRRHPPTTRLEAARRHRPTAVVAPRGRRPGPWRDLACWTWAGAPLVTGRYCLAGCGRGGGRALDARVRDCGVPGCLPGGPGGGLGRLVGWVLVRHVVATTVALAGRLGSLRRSRLAGLVGGAVVAVVHARRRRA